MHQANSKNQVQGAFAGIKGLGGTASPTARGALSERQIRAYLARHEHDACALMASVRRDGRPAHATVADALEALAKMVHRSGDVDGEGDGCGLQLDLPRQLWSDLLEGAGCDPGLTRGHQFAVGHFFIPRTEAYWAKTLKEQICHRLTAEGFVVLHHASARVTSSALGPRGQGDEPEFWQVAVMAPGDDRAAVNRACFQAAVAIEDETELHVVSFSADTVAYKVRGDARVLAGYYPDLTDPRVQSVMAIGHNRYSTNTSTIFERVQPFSVLGHNGEINTIRQLREQAVQIGIPLTRGGSDSQDLNRTIDGLIHLYGVTLFEAMEMLFPPIIGEIKGMPAEVQDLYMYYRQAWGPYAQGPAAIAARCGDYMVASVDAMGLRPFWLIETDETIFFSSEQGIVSTREMVRDPRPLAPGEKVGVQLRSGARPELLTYTQLQERVVQFSRRRFPAPDRYRRFIDVGGPEGRSVELHLAGRPLSPYHVPEQRSTMASLPLERLLAANGWAGEDLQQVRAMAHNGAEPIGSLGYDGPLACLTEQRHNLADYFKESVAVVTNPAVDREREVEHFSTRTVLGARPPVAIRPGQGGGKLPLTATRVELRLPIVLGGHRTSSPIS
ncbi:MAG TPA: glutamate synthase central domain-containing protein, partial [Symbiobacteriaceae bacterium]|nr:glutamate synthase central domain-containing protein [Symbiobacteriaceae bacterium]